MKRQAKYFLLLDPAIDGKSSFAKRFIRKPSKNGFARYQAGAGVGVLLQKTKPFTTLILSILQM
jgi:hypothetical protein